jgi:hypothetical protein
MRAKKTGPTSDDGNRLSRSRHAEVLVDVDGAIDQRFPSAGIIAADRQLARANATRAIHKKSLIWSGAEQWIRNLCPSCQA